MKGYKVFEPDWTCRGYQFKVGETFEEDVTLQACKSGFHFCIKLIHCFRYYGCNSNNKVAEIEALGEIDYRDNKFCTNKIRVIREIEWDEVIRLVNIGGNNTGYGNNGWCNTGDKNIGGYNTGSHNTSYGNVGNYNTGSYNTGYYNGGAYNTGGFNLGNRNSGDYNTGSYNTGDYNASSFNSGCFNTTIPKIRMFNKMSHWTLSDWRTSEAYAIMRGMPKTTYMWVDEKNMSDKEKRENPTYEITGGYLREYACDTEIRQVWWNRLHSSLKYIVKSLPNFDPQIFEEITGIKVD